MDRRMDGQTDRPSYRDARTHLKRVTLVILKMIEILLDQRRIGKLGNCVMNDVTKQYKLGDKTRF